MPAILVTAIPVPVERMFRAPLKKFAILEFDSYNKENESAEAENQKKIPEEE